MLKIYRMAVLFTLKKHILLVVHLLYWALNYLCAQITYRPLYYIMVNDSDKER